jgi:hypothetical protein
MTKKLPTRKRERFADPVRFAESVLGLELWDLQEQILRAIVSGRRVAVKSCHSSGKTFTAAIASLYWAAKYRDGRVIISRDGWRPNKGATGFKVDNIDLEMPSYLQDELASHLAKWARDNQERFIKHQRAQFFEQLADYDGMLNDAVDDGEPGLSTFCNWNDELDALIRSRWAQLVPSGAVELAQQASAAIAKIRDGIREAQAAFKAIAEQKPCE